MKEGPWRCRAMYAHTQADYFVKQQERRIASSADELHQTLT